MYGRGSHLDHVTWTIYTNFHLNLALIDQAVKKITKWEIGKCTFSKGGQSATSTELYISRVVRKPFFFAYAKTKAQISFAVTAKLISAFVFTTRIVQFLYFLNPLFQASSYILWLYSPVCVGPGRKPRRPVFSQRGSYNRHIQKVKTSPKLISIASNTENHKRSIALERLACADPENFLMGRNHPETRGGPTNFTIAKTHIL